MTIRPQNSSQAQNLKTPNPDRKSIIQNSKDEFVWDVTSCSHKKGKNRQKSRTIHLYIITISMCKCMCKYGAIDVHVLVLVKFIITDFYESGHFNYHNIVAKFKSQYSNDQTIENRKHCIENVFAIC